MILVLQWRVSPLGSAKQLGAELVRVPISTVERETGLSKDTLRVWERRYRFPRPLRDSHGERVYPAEQVQKLRVISRLLDRGARPGHLVNLSLTQLVARFESSEAHADTERFEAVGSDASAVEVALRFLKANDEGGLRSQLSVSLLQVGVKRFVVEFVALMNERVGDAWARGEITISQEHLYTEQVQHLLRHAMSTSFPSMQSPTILLTTLPGEEHQIGLLMVQAFLATEGVRHISLGVQTPAAEIARAALAHQVDIVGLSFSSAIKLNVAYPMLEDLRARLSKKIEVWAGGSLWSRARKPVPGVRFMTALTQIPAAIGDYRAA